MTGSDSAHDSHAEHAVHPLTATVISVLLTAMFALVFSKLDSTAPSAAVYTVAVLLGVFSLLWIWVLDRD
jgi:protein-S-isoprenylcysteine O-methyltransferase Ste14